MLLFSGTTRIPMQNPRTVYKDEYRMRQGTEIIGLSYHNHDCSILGKCQCAQRTPKLPSRTSKLLQNTIKQFYRRINFVGVRHTICWKTFYRLHHRQNLFVRILIVGNSHFYRYFRRKKKKTPTVLQTDKVRQKNSRQNFTDGIIPSIFPSVN